MFDIGFWELILIAIMGLVILGPDRLPIAIRTVRNWVTGARKFSDTVKLELTEELRVHELHANLKKAEQTNLQNLSPEVAESLRTLQEAAASVTEPFKKIDTQALDSMISSSIASSSAVTKANSSEEPEHQHVEVKATQEINIAKPTTPPVLSESDKPQP